MATQLDYSAPPRNMGRGMRAFYRSNDLFANCGRDGMLTRGWVYNLHNITDPTGK